MNFHFLFPTHPLKPSQVDPTFADQSQAFIAAGFTATSFPESVIHDRKPLRNIPAGSTVIYRGWMFNQSGYERLTAAITAAGATPITTATQYLAAHHLPNWYPLITDLTPETRILPVTADFESELRRLDWPAYFVKDYVKSLKTARGSIIHDPSEITATIDEMKKFRGELEGGLCVRRVEQFLPNSERRYFVINGRPFAPDQSPVPSIVADVASRIALPVFSVDVAIRDDDVRRVIEIGDGQVSDLVGWDATAFAAIWK